MITTLKSPSKKLTWLVEYLTGSVWLTEVSFFMAQTSTVRFWMVRGAALQLWLNQTGRNVYRLEDGTPVDDYAYGHFECKWQLDAGRIMGDGWHVPYFCSLGDWAGNITDLLTDDRYDPLSFGTDEIQDQLLFRYYTRFMLVVSELITDFREFLKLTNLSDRKHSNSRLSSTLDIGNLLNYINSVCKHKVTQEGKHKDDTKLHQCNHHLPLSFEDSGVQSGFNLPFHVKKAPTGIPDGIVVPALSSLVQVVLDGYCELDKGFQSDRQKFKDFISDPSHGTKLTT